MDLNSPNNKLRKTLLEMIHRLPTVEPLRVHLKEILSLVLHFLETENEDNTLICCKIVSDKCRTFRPAAVDLVQKFLTFVHSLYANFPKMLSTNLGSDRAADTGAQLLQKNTLTKKIALLRGEAATYTTQLSNAREQYSRLHGQYQILQDEANKMTEEQSKLQERIRAIQANLRAQQTAANAAQAQAAAARSLAAQAVTTPATTTPATTTTTTGGVATAAGAASTGLVRAVPAATAGAATATTAAAIAAPRAVPTTTPELQQPSQQHTASVQRLNANIKRQQIVHAQLKDAQQKYATAQKGNTAATKTINELTTQLAQIDVSLAALAAIRPGQFMALPPVSGKHSFKVLSECRNIVILLFQLYKDLQPRTVEGLVPLMVKALTTHHDLGTDSSPQIRVRYTDFIASQVKTLWFLSYCMNRGYADLIKPHNDKLPTCVMRLLRSTPSEASATRKELLIATRHILASELRLGFLTSLDALMDENTLVGSGWTSRDMLRPLAYSTLADLLHHVRDKLSMPQLSRAVHLFLRNILDDTLPLQIQTMSCKLLLNLVQILAPHKPDTTTSRELLMYILHTFITKLESLSACRIPRLLRFATEAPPTEDEDAKKATPKATDPDAVGGAASTAGAAGASAASAPTTMDTALDASKVPAAFFTVDSHKRSQGKFGSYLIEPELWVPMPTASVGWLCGLDQRRAFLAQDTRQRPENYHLGDPHVQHKRRSGQEFARGTPPTGSARNLPAARLAGLRPAVFQAVRRQH